jgi:hypothetical protein
MDKHTLYNSWAILCLYPIVDSQVRNFEKIDNGKTSIRDKGFCGGINLRGCDHQLFLLYGLLGDASWLVCGSLRFCLS